MTPSAALPLRAVEEIVSRAARPDFDRWAEQVARCGHCSHPVRLRGRVEHRTAAGARVAYSTDAEPDGAIPSRSFPSCGVIVSCRVASG